MSNTFTQTGTAASGGLTKAALFQIVHERLKAIGLARKVVSIDNDLLDCLYELSNDASLVLTATTVTTTADTATVAIPSGLRSWYAAAVDEHDVLDGGSIRDYELSIEDTDDPSTGEPTKICEFNGNFYIYDPIPDDAYTVRIYGILEDDDVDAIGLHARCREALVWGVLCRLFIGGELLPNPDDPQFAANMALVERQQNNCLMMYERSKAALERHAHNEPQQIRYRDI